MTQLPFKISLFQKALSFIVPVGLSIQSSAFHPYLEFLLYRNQLQLATEDAIYSDGERYQPYRLAFRRIGKTRLQSVSSCLVLGSGLGSIVQILHKQYRPDPIHYTLVELDPEILKYARIVLGEKKITDIQDYCGDGRQFIKNTNQSYDLVCIDVFKNRTVPRAFIETMFFEDLKMILIPGGIWIMNYILNEEEDWNTLWKNASQVFSTISLIRKQQNIILIGQNPEYL